MGSEWVFPFLTQLAPPHRKTHYDPIFAPWDHVQVLRAGDLISIWMQSSSASE